MSFSLSDQPATPEAWIRLAKREIEAAQILAGHKAQAMQAWNHAGFAMECAVKAKIMAHERLNTWPSRDARPELYVHDMRALISLAAIPLDAQSPLAPALHLALSWNRLQSYNPGRMPRRQARQLIDAAVGANGLVTWIAQQLQITI
ncbi:hypothetical protein [Xanthobacter sp. 126]|uniref:hypothetical protein n=1 Tax=Xanthobacter sp. 126 TaxID=1131814 RepID=UPI00045E94B3|nr:hypothetical protein [Xanthobacter sp. 126]